MASKAPTGARPPPPPVGATYPRSSVTFSILVGLRCDKQNLGGVCRCSLLDVNLNISAEKCQAVTRKTNFWVNQPVRVRERLRRSTK